METSIERMEKRSHVRLFTKGEGYVKFLFGAGTLVDIGKRGLAFQYVQNSGDNWKPLKGSIELDVFKNRPFRNIKGLKCSIVYDTALPCQLTLPDPYESRRCGVEFGHLPECQLNELHTFIKDFNG